MIANPINDMIEPKEVKLNLEMFLKKASGKKAQTA
jgi:hypothetical protein